MTGGTCLHEEIPLNLLLIVQEDKAGTRVEKLAAHRGEREVST